MIRRSLLTTVVLLAGYQLLLPHLPDAFRLTQWGQLSNSRVAQSYLYAADRERLNVIVGTSLAQRIPAQTLGTNFFNLAMTGGSTQTGLEILRRSGARPPMVLVEMNYFYKPADKEFLGSLFQPGLSTLRKHFSMFRDINRPANYAAGVTQWCIDGLRTVTHLIRGRPLNSVLPKPQATVTKVAPEVLALRMRDYEESLDPKLLAGASQAIASAIGELQARGATIAFFEMPVDPELADAKRARDVRAFAHRSFPPEQFAWIELDRANRYFTRDGIHLEPESADAYGRFLSRMTAGDRSERHVQARDRAGARVAPD